MPITISTELVDKAYKILLARAKRRQTIYYGDFYRELGLDHHNQGDRNIGRQLLYTLNENEGMDSLITCLVTSKAENRPFEGFYTLAETEGRIKKGLSEEKKEEFWVNEVNTIFEKYGT